VSGKNTDPPAAACSGKESIVPKAEFARGLGRKRCPKGVRKSGFLRKNWGGGKRDLEKKQLNLAVQRRSGPSGGDTTVKEVQFFEERFSRGRRRTKRNRRRRQAERNWLTGHPGRERGKNSFVYPKEKKDSRHKKGGAGMEERTVPIRDGLSEMYTRKEL